MKQSPVKLECGFKTETSQALKETMERNEL